MDSFDARTASKNLPSNLMQVVVKSCKGEKLAVYYTCSVCSKVFQYNSYLKMHMMKSHEKSATNDNFVPSLAFEKQTTLCQIKF